MKTGLSLVEMATELERQSKAKKDYQITNARVGMLEDGSIGLKTTDSGMMELGVSEYAHGQIAAYTDIPKKYYDRMLENHPRLLAANVNTWLHKKEGRRLVRTLDGRCRAFLSDKYRIIDNFAVASMVLPMLSELNIESCNVDENSMYIKAFSPKLMTEVRVGDKVQWGVIISNGEVGNQTLTIAPMSYRLVCSNGMVMNDFGMKRRHIGGRSNDEIIDAEYSILSDDTIKAENNVIMRKVRDVLKASLSESKAQEMTNVMRQAANVPIVAKSIPEVIEVVSTDFGFNEDESEGILNHLIKGGDLTKFGIAQAISRQAEDLESYDRATDFEKLSFKAMIASDSVWEKWNKPKKAA